MNDPPSPTLPRVGVAVVGADERGDDAPPIDVDRWSQLAGAVLTSEGRTGELTLTFVDPEEMAALNAEHLGRSGPTDVLSFPLDAADGPTGWNEVPVLLGDVVVCPAVAVAQAPDHAGDVDDELALLVVHGVLHVLGHDHAEPDERRRMQTRELELLEQHHWHGPAPDGFSLEHAP